MLDYDAGILIFSPRQCCGSGSGIRCLLDPWIRDPEWVFSGSRISDPGSKDHILKSFDNFFGLWLHEKVWQSFLQIFCATQIRIINYLHGSCSDPIINNFWKSFWFLQVCDLLILSLKTDVNSVADPGCFPGSGIRIRLFLSRIRIFSIPDPNYFSIPDPNFFHPGYASRNLRIFTYFTVLRIRIRDPSGAFLTPGYGIRDG